jgi:hypothetical protein
MHHPNLGIGGTPMSLADHEIRLLCEQFSSLHDGVLPPDEAVALEQVIQQDAAVRALYIRYAHFCAGLEWSFSDPFEALPETIPGANNPKPQNPVVRALGLLGDTTLGPESSHSSNKQPPLVFTVSTETPGMLAGPLSFIGRPRMLWFGGIFTVALIGFGLWAVSPRTPLDVVAAQSGNLVAAAHAEVSSLHLDSGKAKLMLPKVGYVEAEGPADFALLGPMRARLNSGRIKMRVTEDTGRGFVVETPYGEVTDLGTEFGLDLTEQGKAGLVVFDGAVDLRVPESSQSAVTKSTPAKHLRRGNGVVFGPGQAIQQITAIRTGAKELFEICGEGAIGSGAAIDHPCVIADVSDNLASKELKKFYEIVPGGFGEDVLAYVDRPAHQWNGRTKSGLPKFLLGADYVKTFGEDKFRTDTKIRVKLSRPARLYVLFDGRLMPPKWLKSGFRKTSHSIGIDIGPRPAVVRAVENGVGPGNSVDHSFSVWERIVKKPGIVTLEGNGTRDLKGKRSNAPYMYGIAALALDGKQDAEKAQEKMAINVRSTEHESRTNDKVSSDK